MKLNDKDTMVFVENILNPPEPSKKLKEAAAKYKKGRFGKN